MSDSKMQQVLDLAQKLGVLRPKDLKEQGLHREYLRRLEQQGLLTRSGRGLYTPLNLEFSEHHSLAEASRRVPQGVVCLLSALRFHDLTTQNPFEVWLAIRAKARTPKAAELPLHIVYMSGAAFEEGIEEHPVAGVLVRVYQPAKTVADCFKFRNKIGLDVALEALRAVWQDHRATMDELWYYAKLCRVHNVMRPYLESLI